MKWSKYNYIFESDKYGYLLYNSLTNAFAQLDDKSWKDLNDLKNNPEIYKNMDEEFVKQLFFGKVLVESDDDYLNILKINNRKARYQDKNLLLTILPTMACNFKCTYCFEKSRPNKFMSDETAKKILEFVDNYKNLNTLKISWFGGEPLMNFDRIIGLTKEFKKKCKNYKASIVTNGYLFNHENISKLNDLCIDRIQITIDGPAEIHDTRRMLLSGDGTYSKIIENIKKIDESDYNGIVIVRVNVDKENQHTYHKTYSFLTENFKKVHVYPGIVSDFGDESNTESEGCSTSNTCFVNRHEEAKFMFDQYKENGMTDFEFYPRKKSEGCSANVINAYVIGAEGEVYKCWSDTGEQKCVIGNLHDNKWNDILAAKYIEGVDVYDDEKCRRCFWLPICKGGCPKIRMMNKYEGKSIDNCIKFKGNIKNILETYYEIKLKKAEK